MKAREVITRAFNEVTQSKSNIEPVELNDGLRYLNRMMAKLAASGVQVGYTSLTSVDDEITSPNGVILGMTKNLALILWPQYSVDAINPLIKFSAERSLNTMRSQAITVIEPAQFPATLPRGSGNWDGPLHDDFYTNDQGHGNYIASENNG